MWVLHTMLTMLKVRAILHSWLAQSRNDRILSKPAMLKAAHPSGQKFLESISVACSKLYETLMSTDLL